MLTAVVPDGAHPKQLGDDTLAPQHQHTGEASRSAQSNDP